MNDLVLLCASMLSCSLISGAVGAIAALVIRDELADRAERAQTR